MAGWSPLTPTEDTEKRCTVPGLWLLERPNQSPGLRMAAGSPACFGVRHVGDCRKTGAGQGWAGERTALEPQTLAGPAARGSAHCLLEACLFREPGTGIPALPRVTGSTGWGPDLWRWCPGCCRPVSFTEVAYSLERCPGRKPNPGTCGRS